MKEKRLPRGKPAGSLGAAILLACGQRGQEGRQETGQTSAHATASARRREPERQPPAGLRLGQEAGPGGGAELGDEAAARGAAEWEASGLEEAEPEAQAEAARVAAARALQGLLRLVARREPGVRGPWWGSGFLQKKRSVSWKARCGCEILGRDEFRDASRITPIAWLRPLPAAKFGVFLPYDVPTYTLLGAVATRDGAWPHRDQTVLVARGDLCPP